MNTYCSVEALRRRNEAFSLVSAAECLDILVEASRRVDGVADRFFYSELGARIFDGKFTGDGVERSPIARDGLELGCDLLSVTALEADEDGDGDWEEAWDEDEYRLEPHQGFPKGRIRRMPWSAHSWPGGHGALRITGVWGYGNGASASPWKLLGGVVLEAVNDSSTAITVDSGADLVEIGMTLQVEDEQIFVEAKDDDALTVIRGVNGTTAAAHGGGEDVFVAVYPAEVVSAVKIIAGEILNFRRVEGLTSEELGQAAWRWSKMAESEKRDRDRRVLGKVVRVRV